MRALIDDPPDTHPARPQCVMQAGMRGMRIDRGRVRE